MLLNNVLNSYFRKLRKDRPCEWCTDGLRQGGFAFTETHNYKTKIMTRYYHGECYAAMLKTIENSTEFDKSLSWLIPSIAVRGYGFRYMEYYKRVASSVLRRKKHFAPPYNATENEHREVKNG